MSVIWIPLIVMAWGMSALLGSHVAGLRGQVRLDGFKTGLLFGLVGVFVLTWKKLLSPDIDVDCPHCGTRQDVGGDLEWFECWHCEQVSNL